MFNRPGKVNGTMPTILPRVVAQRVGLFFASASLGSAGVAMAQPQIVIKASPASAVVNHPSTSVAVDPGYKLLGGGAFDNYAGAGNMLDGTWPQPNLTGWNARGKDHAYADPASITAYAVQAYDPNNDYDVITVKQVSAVAGGPSARASLPAGYVMTGGGCFVNWGTDPAWGNLLRASYPDEVSKNTWICESRDLMTASPASIEAYVIGVRPRNSTWPMPTMVITKAQGTYGSTVQAQVSGASGYVVTGGGSIGGSTVVQMVPGSGPNPRPTAQTDPTKQSAIFLTASYPIGGGTGGRTPIGWTARGKDHTMTSPGTVTVYAVSVKFPPPPPPPPTCACTLTGPFGAPGANTIDAGGSTASFAEPTIGTFRIQVQGVYGNYTTLDIFDSMNRSVLSVANPAAWSPSPGGKHFAVAFKPASTNSGASMSIHRVAPGPNKWPQLFSTTVYADGRWGFSPDGTLFVVTRLQNNPIQFSIQAYNLKASSPGSAILNLGESNVSNPVVTTSPCGDRLMYFRWTQPNPFIGQSDFHWRNNFGKTLSPIITDATGTTTPSASIIAGGSTGYLVQLNGAKVRSNGQTTFASNQCTP